MAQKLVFNPTTGKFDTVDTNAESILGKDFFAMYSGEPLPTTSPPQFYPLVFAPDFDVVAFVDIDSIVPLNPNVNIISVNLDDADTVDSIREQNSGTVTFTKEGAVMETNGANSGEAGLRIASWNDSDEVPLFDSLLALSFIGDFSLTDAGDAEYMMGMVDQAGWNMLDETSLVKGVWLYWKVVSGVRQIYFVTCDGSNISATDITDMVGPVLGSARRGTFRFSESGVSYYRSGGGDPLAVHAENFPDGLSSNDYMFVSKLLNGASDTQSRSATIYNLTAFVQ